MAEVAGKKGGKKGGDAPKVPRFGKLSLFVFYQAYDANEFSFIDI